LFGRAETINHQTAIFRQVNKEKLATHHDALEFPDGNTVLLTRLSEGQAATVLQLPAQPKTELEVREQRRVGFVG
jgi:phage protein D